MANISRQIRPDTSDRTLLENPQLAPDMALPKSKAHAVTVKCAALISFAVLLSGCFLFENDKPDTENPPPINGGCGSGQCIGVQQYLLTGAGSLDDPCVFDPVVLQCSHCQQSKLELRATNATLWPDGVVFEKDGTVSDRSVNGPGPFDPADVVWTANTTSLRCTTGPGCADGTYTVRLDQPENPVLCSDFGNVTLTIVLS